MSAGQSSTFVYNSVRYVADLAIDSDTATASITDVGLSWLKLNLGKEYCVQEVRMVYDSYINERYWTCTYQDCSTCVGISCDLFILTVSMEGAMTTSSPVSGCKYGNTVKLQLKTMSILTVYEMVVIGTQGKREFTSFTSKRLI